MSEKKRDLHPSNDAGADMIDAEQLALLMEGKLAAQDRAKLLAQLDASPESLEVLADASAVLPEFPRAHSRWRLSPSQWLALAAGLVLAVAIPLAWRSRPEPLPPPEAIVSWLGDASPSATHPWRELRGGGAVLTRDHRAVRIGALLTDLELRVVRNDTSASTAALQVAALLDGFAAGSAAGDAYRALSQRPDTAAARSARAMAEAIAGEQSVRVGAWLEAARIAASRRDSTFFARSETSDALRAASSDASVERLRMRLRARPHDWPEIMRQLDETLAILGRGSCCSHPVRR